MTGYRIDPNGVEAVLNATKSEAEQFGTILSPLQGWVEFAATGTGGSGAIVPALQSFFENQSDGLEAIGTRIGAAITGAYQATKAYVDGDLEMVQTYQQNAVTAANPLLRQGPRLGGF
ncbi:MAG TPA: DUF6507 family protein [Propionibacteriaceae bacterium]|jgi:Family of unknown function (DUF6507)|nr:DUF6507 family protein [Propionibacteriaceae bacterium]